MKAVTYLSYCAASLLFVSCMKVPSAKMTDTYIEIIKPGQTLGLVEVKALKIDSTFGYPAEEREVLAYTIVDRKTHKSVNPNASINMYFNTKNDKYCWQISPDLFSANVYYSDTINIKPYTWYRLTTEKYHFSVYFFLKETKGVYLSKLKPNPGAY